MRTAHTITWLSSEPVSMRPIVARQTPMKTLPSLAVGNNERMLHSKIGLFSSLIFTHLVHRAAEPN